MVQSMTGFAARSGASSGASKGVTWTVEIRGVNAKGLDIRVRAPERMTGFDQRLKTRLQKALQRGNVNVSLRTEQEAGAQAVHLNEDTLDGYVQAMLQTQTRARTAGLALRDVSAAELMCLRGVIGAGDEGIAIPPEADVLETFDAALADFIEMRSREGEALKTLLEDSLTAVEALVDQSAQLAEDRKDAVAATLKANLAAIMANTDGADPDRVAQELAMLAVKADVTEEIDRLRAHVAAARALLTEGGAVGRKLDFLMQEFNREANTLCSKSGSTALTRVGLDLKALIDQMREQVQNVE